MPRVAKDLPTAVPDPDAETFNVVLLGATLTGNRGAESMLQAAVQRIAELEPRVRFTLLSLYPRADSGENRNPALCIVPFSALHMVFVAWPLAVLAGLAARVRLPVGPLLWTRALRSLRSADLAIDLSGISFVDGRGPILLYNVLVVLIPALLGTPLLKYAQALGPFRHALNRYCARWLLPHTAGVAARGRITREFLEQLDLPAGRVRSCADAAFALRVEPAALRVVEPLLRHAAFEGPVVCVAASSVVDGLCRQRGVAYVETVAAFIRRLIDRKGYGVCLLAHSARPGRTSPKNNDLPVCRAIHERVGRARCLFPSENLDAQALRAVIGRSRLLVASRFHAMISGLAMAVPTMLIGWSHKYAEVLEAFELEGYALDYAELTEDKLWALFERLERDEEQVRQCIRRQLPAVERAALKNAEWAVELLAGRGRRAAQRAGCAS